LGYGWNANGLGLLSLRNNDAWPRCSLLLIVAGA